MNCDMIGCKREVYNSLSLGPGTYIAACKAHYKELAEEHNIRIEGDVDMVKNNKEVLEIKLSGVESIPRARDLADILKEWHTWYNTYASLIQNVGNTEDLYERTTEALKKWGRVDA